VNVRPIAEIAGRLKARIKSLFLAIVDWSIRASEFWELLETFCNEAAVLWFVFPVLDGIYDRAESKPAPPIRSILVSFGVAFWFFIAAVYCKKKELKLKAVPGKGE
jgi:hypothetical protein